jgi:SAM-dependent methyltransferase
MLDAAGVTPQDTVCDLGCGDGRIPILAAAGYGTKAVGIEINPALVKVANQHVKDNCVEGVVTIFRGDAATMSWEPGTKVVTAWLPDAVLRRLRPTLDRLPVGSRVVSRDHPIPGWPQGNSIEVEGAKLYRYRMVGQPRTCLTCPRRGGCTPKTTMVKVVEGY